jgi:hypothetical protein
MMRREHHIGVGRQGSHLLLFEGFGLLVLWVGVVSFLGGLGYGCFSLFLGFWA